jgi:hypothetical protein
LTELAPALGVMAALAGVADTLPYVRDTLSGSTRPHRGTWLIWSSLAVSYASRSAPTAPPGACS